MTYTKTYTKNTTGELVSFIDVNEANTGEVSVVIDRIDETDRTAPYVTSVTYMPE
jgi:hypothetical protein